MRVTILSLGAAGAENQADGVTLSSGMRSGLHLPVSIFVT